MYKLCIIHAIFRLHKGGMEPEQRQLQQQQHPQQVPEQQNQQQQPQQQTPTETPENKENVGEILGDCPVLTF